MHEVSGLRDMWPGELGLHGVVVSRPVSGANSYAAGPGTANEAFCNYGPPMDVTCYGDGAFPRDAMRVTSERCIARHSSKGAPICGFISYIDGEKPTLLRRMGWQIASDLHDAYQDQVSIDNGKTWSQPRESLKHVKVEGGYTVFVENATFYSARRGKFVHITDQLFQNDLDGPNENYSTQLCITVDTPRAFIDGATRPTLISRFGLQQGIAVSFTHIFEDKHGRLLVTVQSVAEDRAHQFSSQGYPVREDLPHFMFDIWQSRLLIGTWNADDTLSWKLGNPVSIDIQKSSRGLYEGTVAEVGGRLVMVMRGSNAAWPERPGYKWVAYSSDGGMNWSEPSPLACDDGSLPQSSSTGSYLIRSITNGKLYWIGNLCLNGQVANGNWPRSPVVIAEVQEEPFALRRETITVIGDRRAGEDEFVQHSNLRCYQDRESGEAVVCLTRFGERGMKNSNDWLMADCYEYRVCLE